MQDKDNLFDTDLFQPLYKELINNTDKSDNKYKKIIIDHVKSSTFMISEGVVPTNEGRGGAGLAVLTPLADWLTG